VTVLFQPRFRNTVNNKILKEFLNFEVKYDVPVGLATLIHMIRCDKLKTVEVLAGILLACPISPKLKDICKRFNEIPVRIHDNCISAAFAQIFIESLPIRRLISFSPSSNGNKGIATPLLLINKRAPVKTIRSQISMSLKANFIINNREHIKIDRGSQTRFKPHEPLSIIEVNPRRTHKNISRIKDRICKRVTQKRKDLNFFKVSDAENDLLSLFAAVDVVNATSEREAASKYNIREDCLRKRLKKIIKFSRTGDVYGLRRVNSVAQESKLLARKNKRIKKVTRVRSCTMKEPKSYFGLIDKLTKDPNNIYYNKAINNAEVCNTYKIIMQRSTCEENLLRQLKLDVELSLLQYDICLEFNEFQKYFSIFARRNKLPIMMLEYSEIIERFGGFLVKEVVKVRSS
ncbi:MAG: hypothetical protein HY606_03805, partial [Planctomycetes bacterium]|nr:hypothetical protein [Planctomycetota bacterium]